LDSLRRFDTLLIARAAQTGHFAYTGRSLLFHTIYSFK
jgi:hypothetical protein